MRSTQPEQSGDNGTVITELFCGGAAPCHRAVQEVCRTDATIEDVLVEALDRRIVAITVRTHIGTQELFVLDVLHDRDDELALFREVGKVLLAAGGRHPILGVFGVLGAVGEDGGLRRSPSLCVGSRVGWGWDCATASTASSRRRR